MASFGPVYETLKRLGADALERGLQDVAIVYGWSLMRLSQEHLRRQLDEFRKGGHDGNPH